MHHTSSTFFASHSWLIPPLLDVIWFLACQALAVDHVFLDQDRFAAPRDWHHFNLCNLVPFFGRYVSSVYMAVTWSTSFWCYKWSVFSAFLSLRLLYQGVCGKHFLHMPLFANSTHSFDFCILLQMLPNPLIVYITLIFQTALHLHWTIVRQILDAFHCSQITGKTC